MPKTTLHLINLLIKIFKHCGLSGDPDLCREYGNKMRARDIARGKRAILLALKAKKDKTGKEWTEADRASFKAITEGHVSLTDLRMSYPAFYGRLHPFVRDAKEPPAESEHPLLGFAIGRTVVESRNTTEVDPPLDEAEVRLFIVGCLHEERERGVLGSFDGGMEPEEKRGCDALKLLHKTGFTGKLIADVWRKFPGDARSMDLPKTEPVVGDGESSESTTGSEQVAASPAENRHEQWMSAKEATKHANNITEVGRDWSSFWRGFCHKHNVAMRPGTKADGSSSGHRPEIEFGSLFLAIRKNPEELKRATPEQQKLANVVSARLRSEFGLNEDLKRELLEVE